MALAEKYDWEAEDRKHRQFLVRHDEDSRLTNFEWDLRMIENHKALGWPVQFPERWIELRDRITALLGEGKDNG